jgi:hypothetical protein
VPKFTTNTAAAAEGFWSPAELQSRCAAAAKLMAGSANYSPEDRADMAAKLMAHVLEGQRETVPAPAAAPAAEWRGRTVRPIGTHGRDVLRRMDRLERIAPGLAAAEWVAAVPFGVLTGLASNLRRTLDRNRERDAAYAAASAASADFTPLATVAEDEAKGTPHGARRTAVDMLRNLGALSDGGMLHGRPAAVHPVDMADVRSAVAERRGHAAPMGAPHGRPADVLKWIAAVETGRVYRAYPNVTRALIMDRPAFRPDRRAEAPEGCLWTAAYAAARSSAGVDSREVAEELDVSFDTLRAHLSRAAKRLPSAAVYGRSAHAAAVCIPEDNPERVEYVVTPENAKGTRRGDWRTAPDEDAPVDTRQTDPAPAEERPDWTRNLRPATAARLAAASANRSAR